MFTENDIRKILDDYKKNKSFLDVRDFYKFAKMIIIISYKGTGKSWSAMDSCIDEIQLGNECAWIRNSQTEIQLSNVEESFDTILDIRNIHENYKVREKGIYEIDSTIKNDKGRLKLMFANMTKPYNSASQNALKKCNLIVYDEFINPTFHKKNLCADFLKLCHTVMRKNEAHVILLGNKHEANNDILAELAIEFDWENTQDQIIYRQEDEILALYLDKWEVAGMKSSNDLIEKWSKYSNSMKMFSSGNISSNNMSSVKNWFIHKIENSFCPLFRFDLSDTRYCIGEIDSDENKSVYGVNNPVYIKQLDFDNEYLELPTYCYLPIDKKPDNKYIYDIDNFKTVEFMLNRYSKGELFFSTAYGKEEFKRLLPFLKAILLNENN